LAIEPIDHKEAEWRIAYATEAPSETTDVTKVGVKSNGTALVGVTLEV
jgi:hypothetical protein